MANHRLIRTWGNRRWSALVTGVCAIAVAYGAMPADAATLGFGVTVTEIVDEDVCCVFPDPPMPGDRGLLTVSFDASDLVLEDVGPASARYGLGGDWFADVVTANGRASVDSTSGGSERFRFELSDGVQDLFRITGINGESESFQVVVIDPLGTLFSSTDFLDIAKVLTTISMHQFRSGAFSVLDQPGSGPAGVLAAPQPVPEPSGVLLFVGGGLIVGMARKRSRRKES